MVGPNDQSHTAIPDENNLVPIGRVRRPTGIHGALLIEVYSGNLCRFSVGDLVVIHGSEHQVVSTGRSGKAVKINLSGVDSIETANFFRGAELSVSPETLPENPNGVYYHFEIMGANVKTLEGRNLGVVTEIIETGSNDVMVVTPGSKFGNKKTEDIMLPVLEGVIIDVDKVNCLVTVDPPTGLL
jgi:16S rRNA processing protein RimM